MTLTGYARAISDATGYKDNATLILVEELMRADHGTLDNLSADQFAASAREAFAAAKGLDEIGELVLYCDAVGIDAPLWRH